MADLIDRGAVLAEIGEFQIRFNETGDSHERVAYASAEHCMLVIKAAPAVNRWIPVEDALPEIKEFHISDTVLCYCDSGALAIARLEENGFGQVGFNCEKDDEYHHAAGKVMYWMPIPEIPEPPKEDEA